MHRCTAGTENALLAPSQSAKKGVLGHKNHDIFRVFVVAVSTVPFSGRFSRCPPRLAGFPLVRAAWGRWYAPAGFVAQSRTPCAPAQTPSRGCRANVFCGRGCRLASLFGLPQAESLSGGVLHLLGRWLAVGEGFTDCHCQLGGLLTGFFVSFTVASRPTFCGNVWAPIQLLSWNILHVRDGSILHAGIESGGLPGARPARPAGFHSKGQLCA